MKPWERYSAAPTAKPWERYAAPEQEQDSFAGDVANLTKGAAMGAADIGNTLINASTFIPRKLSPEWEKWNQEREQSLQSFADENQDSDAFAAGRLGANVAGTLGVGGALGTVARGVAPALADAIATGGMSANGAGMATRALGGAINGAASAALVNPEDAGTGAMIGAALPPALKVAGKIGGGIARGVNAMAEPLYEGGRDRILGRTLRSFAGNQADEAMSNLENYRDLVPGSQATAGMAARNPGLAALERASIANNPVATNELSRIAESNNQARLAALEGIAPDLAEAKAARKAATEPLYDASGSSVVQTDEAFNSLLDMMPDGVVQRAQNLAKMSGEPLAIGKDLPDGEVANISGRGLQYLKMAIDDMLSGGSQSSIGKVEKRALTGLKGKLTDWTADKIGAARQADEAYTELSRPVNQSQVMDEIIRRGQDFRGNLLPSKFANALTDRTASGALHYKTTLNDLFNPDQLEKLGAVKDDLMSVDYAQTAGRGVGSNTVQNLAYTNMLDQFGVPTALRGFAPAGVVGNVASKAADVVYKKANEQLASKLAESMLDPKMVFELMKKASRDPQLFKQLQKLPMAELARAAPVLLGVRNGE